MFRILSVTCLLTRKALRLIIILDSRMCLMLSGFACVYVVLYLLSFIASNNLYCYRHCGCPARVCVCVCVCVCVSVHSFLPPRASISRNIGTYVFTVTRKTLYIQARSKQVVVGQAKTTPCHHTHNHTPFKLVTPMATPI